MVRFNLNKESVLCELVSHNRLLLVESLLFPGNNHMTCHVIYNTAYFVKNCYG